MTDISDHDLLIKIESHLSNLMDRVTGHITDENRRYEKLETRVDNAEKLIWIGLGGVLLAELIGQWLLR